jgi:flagellar hook assembly protein FlgD
VSASNAVNLRTNTSAIISFTSNVANTATIKIYDISTGTQGMLVRTLSVNATAGLNTVSWDGRDQSGARVPNMAYLFVIESSDGSRYGRYDASSRLITDTANFQNTNSNCDAYRNIFASWSITVTQPGLAAAQISTSDNRLIYPFGYNGKPIPKGTTTLYWDCRDPQTGEIVLFPVTPGYSFTRFPPNTILVDGVDGAAKIKGVGANVEVKSNPYLVFISYGQFTRISYNLELFNAQNAQVDIKLLPPQVLNFDDPQAIPVFSGIQGAGDHEVTWTGQLSGTENAKRSMSSAEGAYTFVIKTNTNGISSLYRGTLNVYQ